MGCSGNIEATKDAQIIRKDNVVSGNINEDCLENNNGNVENQACWNSSAGTNSENSEWVYYEDPDNGNSSIPDVDSFSNAGYHYCATCDNYLTVNLTDNDNPIALPNADFIYNEIGNSGLHYGSLEGSITLDASYHLIQKVLTYHILGSRCCFFRCKC